MKEDKYRDNFSEYALEIVNKTCKLNNSKVVSKANK